MSIYDVLVKRLDNVKVNHKDPFLKPGQIVQGKIVKLFPNNKAQIQLGSQTMTAQLEASLIIGQNYHFQVKSTADVTHLQVIGERIQRNTGENMRQLLQGLGIKPSKQTIVLMNQLMENKLPFDKDQLIKAVHLLEGAKDKGQAQLITKEMIAYKLPLTESIFQSLYTKATNGFSDQLNGLLQQLKQDTKQTQLKQTLINRIASLTVRTDSTNATISKHILSEIESNQTTAFVLATTAGLVKKGTEFSAWKTNWRNFQSMGPSQVLPFQLDSSEFLKTMEKVVNNQYLLINQSRIMDQLFSPIINKTNIHQTPLSPNDFTGLKTQIETKLFPLMTDKQQQQVKILLQNNLASLEQLQTMIKILANKQTYHRIDSLIKSVTVAENKLFAKPHEIFLAQVRQVLQSIGLAHEYQLAKDPSEKQTTTIKSMLMQLVQQSDGATQTQANQLLHFINGMQIQSVNDGPNFLQASIQIPGEKMNLNNDLQLEFEGKKMESGKIDPAYCRILFYLHLTNLKETIVDMNIQKRSVAVTIFNENPTILDQSDRVKTALREGLTALNYNLSKITLRTLNQREVTKNNTSIKTEDHLYQGVDYRI